MLSLRNYRRACVPLLAIQTVDPAEVLQLAVAEMEASTKKAPVIQWDCVHGLRGVNEEGTSVLSSLVPDPIVTTNATEALVVLEKLQDDMEAAKGIVVMIGLVDFLNPTTTQALWNLRDVLPSQGILLIMAVPLGWRNPMPDDIVMIEAPLPTRENHIETALRLCKDASVDTPSVKTQEKIADALAGLGSFSSVQALSLSISKNGLNIDSLWERKRQQISETPGLMMYTGTERFNDLGGLDQAKKLFRAYLNGKRKPGAVFLLDEVEKVFAGAAGDTSGVSQAILGYLLTYMQDYNAAGAIFIGPPGAAKSAFSKAIGNEGGMPTIAMDLGGVRGSLVGESEARMRKNLAVATAVSGGRPFFVATCNSISVLPPELRRRFNMGTIFFDLPSDPEKKVIWDIYLRKYDLPKQTLPKCVDWTGAEIKQCADMADRLGVTLVEAAKFVVPVATSAREKIQSLREQASGRYLSASNEGIYVFGAKPTTKKRAFNIDN